MTHPAGTVKPRIAFVGVGRMGANMARRLKRDHECWFSAAHPAKDSGLAAALAEEEGLLLPVNAATRAQYERMVAAGPGGLDKSGIAELTFPGRHQGAAGS